MNDPALQRWLSSLGFPPYLLRGADRHRCAVCKCLGGRALYQHVVAGQFIVVMCGSEYCKHIAENATVFA